jgi:hypothetical protein
MSGLEDGVWRSRGEILIWRICTCNRILHPNLYMLRVLCSASVHKSSSLLIRRTSSSQSIVARVCGEAPRGGHRESFVAEQVYNELMSRDIMCRDRHSCARGGQSRNFAPRSDDSGASIRSRTGAAVRRDVQGESTILRIATDNDTGAVYARSFSHFATSFSMSNFGSSGFVITAATPVSLQSYHHSK